MMSNARYFYSVSRFRITEKLNFLSRFIFSCILCDIFRHLHQTWHTSTTSINCSRKSGLRGIPLSSHAGSRGLRRLVSQERNKFASSWPMTTRQNLLRFVSVNNPYLYTRAPNCFWQYSSQIYSRFGGVPKMKQLEQIFVRFGCSACGPTNSVEALDGGQSANAIRGKSPSGVILFLIHCDGWDNFTYFLTLGLIWLSGSQEPLSVFWREGHPACYRSPQRVSLENLCRTQ